MRNFAACCVATFASVLAAQEPAAAPQTAPQEAPQTAPQPRYDPLRIQAGDLPESVLRTVTDPARDREIPLRIHLPTSTDAAPVVLFSHGLGGTRDGSGFLGRHWAARGYVAVFLQHPGSDASVWRDVPLGQRMAAMQRAASAQNLALRCADVTAVLDAIERWNADSDDACHGRFDTTRVAMAGHSFGAVTTQAVSGQTAPLVGAKWTDRRIDAAIVLSPSSPRRGDAEKAFGAVHVPWLLMTGTRDTSPIGDQDVASRLRVYPALPPTIDRFELVLDGAQHSVFTDARLPGDGRRDPAHHTAICAIATAFLDAYLRDDAQAKAWLLGDGARSVLAERDRWQAAERRRNDEPKATKPK